MQRPPDAGLYPEYDERLGQAMAAETELFLGELIARDLGVRHLVDADFTFVNRRLAEHYGIEGIAGQHMRKVDLAPDSVRGGLLAQAAIHKLTANGTDVVTGAARQLRPREPARPTGAAAATECGGTRARHPGHDDYPGTA